MQFGYVGNQDGTGNVTAFYNGTTLLADQDHANYGAIKAALVNDNPDGLSDDEIAALFDLSVKAAALFQNLSSRVSVRNSRVYVDQTEVEDAFADQIIRFLEEGDDEAAKPLVRFLEKVYSNASAAIRENLSRWLNAESLTILPDGNILGYRGLNSDFTSKHAGPGIVNGVEVNGYLDNSVGNVVEMDADAVTVDPSIGCAPGLHVGTHAYAVGWASGGVVVKVAVNPAHVRSVPYECNDQKMRVSKYVVLAVADGKVDSLVDDTDYSDYDDDMYDEYDYEYDDGRVAY